MSQASIPVKPKITYGALVGRVIEHRRNQLGLHQAPLAAALGVTQSAYSRLEQGQSSMSVTQLQTVARELRATPTDILADVERFAAHLHSQGAEITDEKQDSSAAGLLIALGILAALLAATK